MTYKRFWMGFKIFCMTLSPPSLDPILLLKRARSPSRLALGIHVKPLYVQDIYVEITYLLSKYKKRIL